MIKDAAVVVVVVAAATVLIRCVVGLEGSIVRAGSGTNVCVVCW